MRGIGEKEKRFEIGLFIAMGMVFLFTRLFRVTDLPHGLHIDEVGIAYDAWCLANYGVDRYLKSWPVYFTNYLSGQNALYTYLCVLCMKIFGNTVWAIRMPAVFSAVLTLVFGMLVTRESFPRKPSYCWWTGMLITICPYFIMASRFGLESNLVLGFSTMFLYVFLLAIRKESIGYYVLAGALGGILLYTYALTYIFAPLFLLMAFMYCVRTKQFCWWKWGIMAIPWGILASPLIAVQLINMLDLPEQQWGIFTITKLVYYRASEIGRFSLSGLWDVLRVLVCGDDLRYNTAPGYANLYAVSLVFLVIGVFSVAIKAWRSVKECEFIGIAIVFIWFVAVVATCCHIAEINVNKMNGVFFCVALFTAIGIVETFERMRKRKIPMQIGIMVGYTLLFLGFVSFYYGGRYQQENYPISYFDVTVAEAIERIEMDDSLCGKTTYMAEDKEYFAISAQISPYDMVFPGENKYLNYVFGTLPEISTSNNYIVRDMFAEYKQSLREYGFIEEKYPGYSLFYIYEE